MTLDTFITQNNGKAVDVDGAYGGQCWDLVELYAEQVLGVPKEPWAITLGPNGSAREAWTVFDSHMQRHFDKLPGSQKQRGDILVYGYAPDGHIAICLGGSSVFQENSPIGSSAHVGTNSDSGLLGVLRKKGEDMLTPAEVNQLCQIAFNRPAHDDEKSVYSTIPTEQALQRILDGAENKNLRTDAQSYRDKNPCTVLSPGIYKVN